MDDDDDADDVGKGLPLGAVREVFPKLQTVNESRAIAAEARNMLLDPFVSGGGDENDDDDL